MLWSWLPPVLLTVIITVLLLIFFYYPGGIVDILGLLEPMEFLDHDEVDVNPDVHLDLEETNDKRKCFCKEC